MEPIDLTDLFARVKALGESVVPNMFLMARARILFTGHGPYSIDHLSRLLPESSVLVEDPEDDSVDLIVIGHFEYSEDAIEIAIDDNDPAPRCVPQEGFIDEVLFGRNWWEMPAWLNWMADRHAGLGYARSLAADYDFQWPSVEAPESTGESDREAEFRDETELHRFGYQITGKSRASRWAILEYTAMPKLGLQVVAETIASHIRVRKAQRDGRTRYAHAIAEWEFDLAKLRREYYEPGRHHFQWPSTEP